MLELGPMANCTYIVSNGDKAIAIDPSWEPDAVDRALEGKKLEAVFFTHGHFDHTQNAEELLHKHKIKAYMDERDVILSKMPESEFELFTAPKTFNIAGMEIETLHTPGHTRGGICIKIGNNLFTGDTLFQGSCGRVTLPYASPSDMRRSLYELSKLPPQTRVFTGHTYGSNETTIGDELKHNVYMQNARRDFEGKHEK